MKNIQTGNPVILVDVEGIGYVYLEQHKKITIQAHVDAEGTYLAIAVDIFDGRIGEVNDYPCLDDALLGLEVHYGSQLKGWYSPQTLGL
jgi:hypothetical protein